MNHASIEKVERNSKTSFEIVDYIRPIFSAPYHLHPEYELILIEEGEGTLYVGDHIGEMKKGDFMLIGRNLPHLWLSADEYYLPNSKKISHSIYTQFPKEVVSSCHLLPEMKDVAYLLDVSQKGLIFSGKNIEKAKCNFRSLLNKQGFEKLIGFYRLLNFLAQKCNYKLLASDNYTNDIINRNDKILRKVNLYINQHYQKNITLDEIASAAAMNTSALCRYYKKKTGQTMFEYISELRISYALKLLTNQNIPINNIAYDCGYNSLSHFNRQFKKVTGHTPSDFSKMYKL